MRDQIVEEARSWVGVPWRHQGRNRRGVDCCGLIVVLAQAFNLSDHDVKNYRRNAQGQDFTKEFAEHMDEVCFKDAEVGDVILFRFGRFNCHSAIISGLNPLRIIHAYEPAKKVIEEYLPPEAPLYRVKTKTFRFRGVQ